MSIPRVVMAVGGWDSFAAIEPYLNAPSEDVIDDAFDKIEGCHRTISTPKSRVNAEVV
jgi:hypothetical protein